MCSDEHINASIVIIQKYNILYIILQWAILYNEVLLVPERTKTSWTLLIFGLGLKKGKNSLMTAGLGQRTLSILQFSCFIFKKCCPSFLPLKAKLLDRVCFRSLCSLVKEMKTAENTAALFIPVLLTNLVSLYTKGAVYCLISPDTSRTVPLPALAAVDFTVSHCSTKEAQARKMPLCENAT